LGEAGLALLALMMAALGLRSLGRAANRTMTLRKTR
jgi:hypothetical protein